MDLIYVLVFDKLSWEDLCLYTSEDEAIQASIKNPTARIELFTKTDNGYIPTYNYYKSGKFIENT